MKMIILCGGLGTRLREVIGEKQKTMADVKGKPFLEILIDYYKKFGIKDYIFACGYKKEEIYDYFKDGKDFGINCQYAVEEEPLGTAGAIRNCLQYIDDELVYVVNGDTLYEFDINLLNKSFNHYNADMTIATKKANEETRYGFIDYDVYDENYGGIIKSFNEKNNSSSGRSMTTPTQICNVESNVGANANIVVAKFTSPSCRGEGLPSPKFINGGIYLMKKSLIAEIPLKKCSIEIDIIPSWIKNNKRISFINSESYFIDIGTKDSYKTINELQKIAFLDRDGTICDDAGAFHKNILDYEELINNIKLVPGVKESLHRLKVAGYLIVVVSNQAGLAKGKFKENAIHRFNKNLNALLDDMIDGFYYCIHHDTARENDGRILNEDKIHWELIYDCDCRKPKAGMFYEIENDLQNGKIQYIDQNIINSDYDYLKDRTKIYKKNIEPTQIDKDHSFMVGDKIADTIAGRTYGIKSYFVLTGEGQDAYDKGIVKLNENTDYIVKDLNEVVDKVLS